MEKKICKKTLLDQAAQASPQILKKQGRAQPTLYKLTFNVPIIETSSYERAVDVPASYLIQ